MTWHRTVAGLLTDILWVTARSGILINAIILSVFSVWFVGRSLWELHKWLERWLFS